MRTPEHFKLIFSSSKNSNDDKQQSSDTQLPSDDFIDNKKEVPFIGDFEDNPTLVKLSPSFLRLNELYVQIKEM